MQAIERMRKRWTELICAGALAAAVMAAPLAWAQPRRSTAPVPAAAPTPKDNAKENANHANFPGKLPIRELNEDEAILHALNKLGFGARPGQVEQIKQTGLENWIQAQLHPENLTDAVVDARIAQLPALPLSAAQLLDQYPPQDVAAKRLGLKIDEYQKRVQDLAKKSGGTNSMPFKDQNEIVNELMAAKIIRAMYSERQLSEQLADFWFNHFNIFVYKDLDRWYLIPYEREAIRPHVLGKFRDLL
jgi:uncharacterized protein (DUF1800 family)